MHKRASQRSDPAFTLFEILVVVGLIAAIAAVLLPRIGGGLGLSLRNGARVVAADLRYASQRAVATGRPHRWVVDIENQAFRIEEWTVQPPEDRHARSSGRVDLRPPTPEAEFLPVVEKTAGSWRWLEESSGVGIDSVVIGELALDEELASVAFGNDGGADPAQVVLSDDYGHVIAVQVLAFTGEVRIVDEPEEGARGF